jgi:hypothetical protein
VSRITPPTDDSATLCDYPLNFVNVSRNRDVAVVVDIGSHAQRKLCRAFHWSVAGNQTQRSNTKFSALKFATGN